MKSRITAVLLIGIFVIVSLGCGGATIGEESTPNSRLFATSCQSCHILPKPTIRSDEEWPQIVQKYGQKANLSDEQIDRITIYLLANN